MVERAYKRFAGHSVQNPGYHNENWDRFFNGNELRDVAYASLSDAISAIGSDEKTLIITSKHRINSKTTIPENISIVVAKGGGFDIKTGAQLTIKGHYKAGLFRTFWGSGTVILEMADYFLPHWWAAISSTDNSTAILQAASAASDSPCRRVLIPPGVRFNIYTVLASLPANVVIDDQSMVNDFASAGETAKRTGIISADTAENDTHNAYASGHHTIVTLNNYRTSGTQSADEAKASILYASGQFLNPSNSQKRGFRGVSIVQFTRETGGQFLKLAQRRLAPWVAIGGIHLAWESGLSIGSTGLYRSFSGRLYSSASTGTTGSTAPTHTTGTVTDGAVTWTFVRNLPAFEEWRTATAYEIGDMVIGGNGYFFVAASAGTSTGSTAPSHSSGTTTVGGNAWTYVDTSDSSIWGIDESGRVLIGQGSGSDAFRHKVGANDLGSTYLWWGPNQAISGAGVNRRWGNNLYVSTGSGTTSTTPPTHTAGTVSDGTVSWTYVSTGGNYVMELAARGASKVAILKLTPTNSSGTETTVPNLRAEEGVGLRVQRADGNTDLAVFDDDRGFVVRELAIRSASAADGDTTPSVEGVGALYVGNTSATSITALDDGDDDQVVELIFTNANTKLVHASTLMLKGGIDAYPPQYGTIRFRRVPTSISTRWIETYRSWANTSGTATLVAGTVTVNTAEVAAGSKITLSIQSLGTVAAPKAIGVTARTAGTSFTITSADATDTSVVAWEIVP